MGNNETFALAVHLATPQIALLKAVDSQGKGTAYEDEAAAILARCYNIMKIASGKLI